MELTSVNCFGDIEGHEILIESTKRLLLSSDTSIFLGDIFQSLPNTNYAEKSFQFIKYLHDNYADKTFNPDKDYWQFVKNDSGIMKKNTPIEQVEKGKINFLIGNKEFRLYRKALHGGSISLVYFKDRMGWTDKDLKENEIAMNWYYSRCRAILQNRNILFVHNFINIDRISIDAAKSIDTIVCGHNRSTYQFDYYSKRHNKMFKIMMIDLSDICKVYEGKNDPLSENEEKIGVFRTGSIIKGSINDELVNCIIVRNGIPSYLNERLIYDNHYLMFSDDYGVLTFDKMRLHPTVYEKITKKYGSRVSPLMSQMLYPFSCGYSMLVQWLPDYTRIPALAVCAADFVAQSEYPRQALFAASNRENAKMLFKQIKEMTENVSLYLKGKSIENRAEAEVIVTTASYAYDVLDSYMNTELVKLFVVYEADYAVRFGQLEHLEAVAAALKGRKLQAIVIGKLIPYRAKQLAYGYCQIPICVLE